MAPVVLAVFSYFWIIILLDHLVYPGCLARTVNIMSSILSSSFEGIFPIQTIWSNSGDENGGLSGKIPHLSIIKIAYFDSYLKSKFDDSKKMVANLRFDY
jgi:hypothetical protein